MKKQKTSKIDAKSLALDLYLNTSKSQKEIAKMCGVVEGTVSNWKRQGDWEKLKAAKVLSSQELIANLYKHALKISQQEDIDTDKLSKIASSIEKLKPGKSDYVNYMNAFIDFNNWLVVNGHTDIINDLKTLQAIFLDELAQTK